MTRKATPPERFSLSRWSRRKHEARGRESPQEAVRGEIVEPRTDPRPFDSPEASGPLAERFPETSAPPAARATAPELPSVDSLSFDSDFTAFLRPEVDEKLKRAALKQLFRDPRFNVMDGLDTYIDDYTRADPIEPGVLGEMLQRFSAVASATTPSAEAPLQLEAPAETTSTVDAPPAAVAAPSAADIAPLPAASAEPAAAKAPPKESSAPHSPS